jgi:hypothetical protein
MPDALNIRVCEGCHGISSLHNIQVDSPNIINSGFIDPGQEFSGWGHIGNNKDCWGCHGFAANGSASGSALASADAAGSVAPGSGPLVPYIDILDKYSFSSGSDTKITVTGSAFTNTSGGVTWSPGVELTADDGSSTVLAPDAVSLNSLTVTVPDSMDAGNYELRLVKGDKKSNPIVISITPDVSIDHATCDRRTKVLTITGSGFGKKTEGTDAFLNVEINGNAVQILSWSDTEITARVPACRMLKKSIVSVHALFGSATGDIGKGKSSARKGSGRKGQ